MNLKEYYERIKANICIDKEIRELFSMSLNLGNIVRVTSHRKDKFSTCNPHMPSEYFSKENIVEEFGVVTDRNEEYVIREEYLGLNFESPCDKYILHIYDKNEYVVADTSDLENYLESKKQVKQKRKSIRK